MRTAQSSVSEVTDPDCFACGYCNSKIAVYEAGMLGALTGAAFFLAIASFTAMPVRSSGGTWRGDSSSAQYITVH